MTTLRHSAFLGSLVADAVSMPGHWYYDRDALRRDYTILDHYVAPKSYHPDSILWRSSYDPLNEKGDILREQAQYWGQRGVHYHQFLKAGENTVNYRLATELFLHIQETGTYDAEAWLEIYVQCMLTPDWHQDTYLEEYHRAFFTRYSQGYPLLKCGIRDEHIGGLSQIPALFASLVAEDETTLCTLTKQHVALTHRHSNVLRAADCLTRLLLQISNGTPLRDAIMSQAGDWISTSKAEKWATQPDEYIIGQRFSPACYIDQAFPAALYLAWKYHDDFDAGITANAMVGGDNCHRASVVGSLLGAANGIHPRWLEGLQAFNNPKLSLALSSTEQSSI